MISLTGQGNHQNSGNIVMSHEKLNRFKYGFTFIEILLVTVILITLAAMSIPQFMATYRSLNLQTTAETLVYLMRYAQSRAVTQKIPVRLQFDSAYEHFWLTQPQQEDEDELFLIEPGKEDGLHFTRIPGRWGKDFDITDNIEVETDMLQVTFYSDGRIDSGRIYLCHQEKCMTVSTQDRVGHVKVYDQKI